MTRYRWFRADWPFDMRRLAERLKRLVFSPEVGEGFILERVRDHELQARYVQKIDFQDVIVDPFGHESSNSRTVYTQTLFTASVGPVGLELVDAGRSLQSFVSRLLEVADFNLAIAPLQVDVVTWADAICIALEAEAVVDTLQVGAMQLRPGVSARIVIRGKEEVRHSVSKLVGDYPHVIEKLQLRLSGDASGTVLLSRNGTARILAAEQYDILNAARITLTKIQTSH